MANEKEMTIEEYKVHKKNQRAVFAQMQALPYEIKLEKAKIRAYEFLEETERRGLNQHVSVGGLDSMTLLLFLRKIGINVPAIGVRYIEDRSIQAIHKELGVINIKPGMNSTQVLNTYGFPIISKKIAGNIQKIQNPTEKNKTVRHAIITGECGEQGHFAKNSRMQLPKKWLQLFGGCDEEGKQYQDAFFKVSNKCCEAMKEKPCRDWAKEHNSVPYLGLMASEGGQREDGLVSNGCNYYGKTVIRSAPFGIFMRQDLLQLAIDLDVPVPSIYGTIERKEDGTLYTTKAQRTGCSMCGFGVHMEKRPHRFDQLRKRNYKEWEYYMYKCVTDPVTGEKYGWGKVLDYIGVPWEDSPEEVSFENQLSLF